MWPAKFKTGDRVRVDGVVVATTEFSGVVVQFSDLSRVTVDSAKVTLVKQGTARPGDICIVDGREDIPHEVLAERDGVLWMKRVHDGMHWTEDKPERLIVVVSR